LLMYLMRILKYFELLNLFPLRSLDLKVWCYFVSSAFELLFDVCYACSANCSIFVPVYKLCKCYSIRATFPSLNEWHKLVAIRRWSWVWTLGFKRLFGTDSWRGMRQLVDGTSTLPASEDPVWNGFLALNGFRIPGRKPRQSCQDGC